MDKITLKKIITDFQKYANNLMNTGFEDCNAIFSRYENFEHRVEFNHKEKRLFQVSEMLTYIDKYDYKYKNKMSFTKSEKYFFNFEEIRKILKELQKRDFKLLKKHP